MIKRPLDKRFSVAVRDGTKTTTIRDGRWPIDVPIMLYNWSGLPYRSKHRDVAEIKVLNCSIVYISRDADDNITYKTDLDVDSLYVSEGFESQRDMDAWFRPLVKRCTKIEKQLMSFCLNNGELMPQNQ